MSEPVPSPAALRTAAKWLGRRDGPLTVARLFRTVLLLLECFAGRDALAM